jgi:hypothetical protein
MSLRIPAALLALLLATPAFTATRLTYEIQGTPTALEWAPTSFPLPYEIDQRLTQAKPNAQELVDAAFAAWSSLPETNIQFENRGSTTDVSSDSTGRIVVSLADDLFKGQGALAMTTYSFDRTTGNFTDADIMVDPALLKGNFNLQMAVEHEIGHVLGLDHSGVISAVMYPFLSNSDTLVGFDSDDRIGISTTYPKNDPTLQGATLTGRVMGSTGGIFGAQVVAVNDRGQPVATSLTDATGEFTLAGIPAGAYRVYAEPLDGPVDPHSLRGTWRGANALSFPTQFFGEVPLVVESGRVYGNLMVTAAGGMGLNPKWIGACAPTSTSLSLGTTPLTVNAGNTVKLAVGGDGFTSGMTEFEVLNPGFRRVSEFQYASNYVSAQFQIDPAATAGSAVVLVRSGNEVATLTGALRVHRAASSPKTRAVRR